MQCMCIRHITSRQLHTPPRCCLFVPLHYTSHISRAVLLRHAHACLARCACLAVVCCSNFCVFPLVYQSRLPFNVLAPCCAFYACSRKLAKSARHACSDRYYVCVTQPDHNTHTHTHTLDGCLSRVFIYCAHQTSVVASPASFKIESSCRAHVHSIQHIMNFS